MVINVKKKIYFSLNKHYKIFDIHAQLVTLRMLRPQLSLESKPLEETCLSKGMVYMQWQKKEIYKK